MARIRKRKRKRFNIVVRELATTYNRKENDIADLYSQMEGDRKACEMILNLTSKHLIK